MAKKPLGLLDIGRKPHLKPSFQSTLLNEIEAALASGDQENLPVPARLAMLNVKVYREPLSQHDLDFLFRTLSSSSIPHVVEAAVILSGLDDTILKQVVDIFATLPRTHQHILVPLIASTFSSVCAEFLFTILKETTDDRWADMVILCLSKSDFPIFNIVFIELEGASLQFKVRAQSLLQKKGLEYAKPFLMALPAIPYLAFYEGVYGKEAIREIQRGYGL